MSGLDALRAPPHLGRMRLLPSIVVRLAGALALGTTALAAQAKWTLTEVARIGGADEGLASFNDIRDLQLGDDGKVWVLDFQARELRLFAPDGAPLRLVARRGQGPGEIANSNGFRRHPDGRMLLRDHSNARLNVYAPDGTTLGQHLLISMGYGYRLEAGIDAQGRFLELVSVRNGNEFRRAVTRTSAALVSTDTVDAPTPPACSPLPPPAAAVRGKNGFAGYPFSPSFQHVFTRSGALWCASTGEYRLRRFAFGAAAHDLEVRLDVPRIPIAKAARDSAIAGMKSFLDRIGGALEPMDEDKVPRDRGALLGFETDERERLWVIRETPSGTAELDVWDVNGRRIATLAPGWRVSAFPLFRVHRDRVAIVLRDADDLPTIHVYRLEAR